MFKEKNREIRGGLIKMNLTDFIVLLYVFWYGYSFGNQGLFINIIMGLVIILLFWFKIMIDNYQKKEELSK